MRWLTQSIAVITLTLTSDGRAQESLCDPCVDPPVERDALPEYLPIPRTFSVHDMARFLPQPSRPSAAPRKEQSAKDNDSKTVSGDDENGAGVTEGGADDRIIIRNE